MQQQAGEYHFFGLESVLYKNKNTIESHESSISQLINIAEKSDYIIPDIMIMGIEPDSIEFGQNLSAKINSRLADYAQQAIQFIKL